MKIKTDVIERDAYEMIEGVLFLGMWLVFAGALGLLPIFIKRPYMHYAPTIGENIFFGEIMGTLLGILLLILIRRYTDVLESGKTNKEK